MIGSRIWLPSLVAVAVAVPIGSAKAETAEDVEAALSQAFKKTPDPISDQDWSNIAGPKISETYEIQKGDTLWDISVTLFGNGFYWPKVWQLNGDIPNPHEISPGRTLTFTGGTAAEPPRLALDKPADGGGAPEEPPVPVADGGAGGSPGAVNPSNPEDEEGPIIPPPQTARKSVLQVIPPSFKSMQSLMSQEKYDENGFNLEKEPPRPPRPLAVASVLVSDEIPSPIAKIREFEAGTKYGQLNQKVFLRSLDIKMGDKLSAYNIGDEIKTPKSGEYQGRALLSAGEINVIGRVGSEEDLFEGVITYSTDLISVDSLLLKGSLPRFDYSLEGKPSQIDGKIVGGEGGQKNRVFGNQNIVFLNVGRGNGVKEGMI
ncbi:MAG: LysM peptidoglycan-binding domain-containing protein, partial [Bdellovibrionales bacterium]|nr:LysM peptidoglycan-binding domain-containing protein [Bdellovibrionales bacterium]